MRRAAPVLVASAGVLLVVLGVVLVVRDGHRDGGLRFLSPEQYELLRSSSRRAEAGRLLLVAGAALLGALGGRLLARPPRPGLRTVVVTGVLPAGLVVAGLLLLQSAGRAHVTVYTGSYEPLACSDWPQCDPAGNPAPGDHRFPGAGSALAGGLLLGAVTGRRRDGDQRTDQG